ncbi:MAG: MFS transporter [Adlercreutzia sp.]|nr:MFS transporter [Adlercreutzia sp.]
MQKAKLSDAQSLRGFILATVTFMAIFASTAVPIPLYADYQATIGLTTADISNTMFTYLTAVALTLLFAGRISDSFGRTPITSLTVMLAILGCIMFLRAESGIDVLAARFVQGLAAGFGMSAVSALVIDCVGEKHLSWGSTVASCGSMFGIMVGSVGVGILYGLVPSLSVIYGVMIAVLAVCLFLLPIIHEPLDRTVSLRASVKPRLFIPPHHRRLFAVVGVCYVVTWTVSNFFQSFAAPIAYQCFGETSPMAGSLILALVMAPSLLGSPLVARMNPRRALVASLVAVTVTTAAMGVLVGTGQEYGFMAVCAVFSVAMGVCVATSLRMLLLEVSVLQVSAILSSVNLVAYAGSAVTGLGTGALLGATSYPMVFFVMVVLLVAASVFVCSSLRAPQAQRSSSRLTLKKFHKMKGVEPSAAAASESAPATLEEPAAATL